jgi:PKHD-type hydroxylase
MIICIANLLTPDALCKLRDLLEGARFADGKATAGWHARLVKHNEQAIAPHTATQEAAAMVAAALRGNEVFRSAVLPRRLRPILFARYGEGRAYGAHVDDALMGLDDPAGPVRTDVAGTVFLAAADAYDGGELVIESTAGEQAFKLGAGDAIAYPATTLHRVEPVPRGVRLVAVTWVQSLVRDPAAREVLFDLDAARRAVFERKGKSPAFDLIAKSHANLLRRWAES